MPFKFRHLCELLQALDDHSQPQPNGRRKGNVSQTSIIVSWFKKYQDQIPRHGESAVAFLSSLFPERRADRVYNVQEARLERVVGRSLALGTTRLTRLRSWKTDGGGDFAQMTQTVMGEAEFDRPKPEHEVTLDEIDKAFDCVAAWYQGSSPELRRRVQNPVAADQAFPPILRRLQSVEAKWLIRMFFKNYSPVILPEALVMHHHHLLLSNVLCFQNTFRAAIDFLDKLQSSQRHHGPQDRNYPLDLKAEAARYLKPQVGVMIQRPAYDKARSLQHCCNMAARKRMSIERKYDGEYCQVHVELSKSNAIQIFSKSGKDSTQDRVRLLGVIETALKLKTKDCLVKKHCILEGELVIWHEKEKKIQAFDKIRKHVTRNGRFIGIEQDSPRDLAEKPMIIFYDLLVLDDIVCLHESLEQRRSRLRSLIRRQPGQADVGYREKINFASADAKALLRRAFVKAMSRGWEGFVLKGCGDPYFSLDGSARCIKLKKDYLPGLGDVADLIVVGARKGVRDGARSYANELRWNIFYLACLENAEGVRRFDQPPKFRIVGTVNPARSTVSLDRARLFNQLGQFQEVPYSPNCADIQVILDLKVEPPSVLFKQPFVVEALGSGFEKPQGVAYHTLRFPRISKIHDDRAWSETTSFDELQELAQESLSRLSKQEWPEEAAWLKRLLKAEPESPYVDEYSPGGCSNKESRSCTNTNTETNTTTTSRPSERSPLLVRVDTQDLTFDQTGDSTVPAGTEILDTMETIQGGEGSSKRKGGTDTDSPHASAAAKRTRLSPEASGLAKKHVEPKPQAESPGAPSRERQPLIEIILSPPEEIRNKYIASEERNAGSRPIINDNSRRSHVNKADDHVPERTPGDAVQRSRSRPEGLPTSAPAEASAKLAPDTAIGCVVEPSDPDAPPERKKDAEEAVEPVAQLRDHGQKMSAGKDQLHSFSAVPDCSPVIYLISALSSRNILPDLVATNASFTFSPTIFLHEIESSPARTHLVLVPSKDCMASGQEMSKLHSLILERLRKPYCPEQLFNDTHINDRKRQVILLDYHILRRPHRRAVDTAPNLSLTDLELYFIGCLAWSQKGRIGPGAANEPSSFCLKPVWEWEDVLALIQQRRSVEDVTSPAPGGGGGLKARQEGR